MANRRKIKPEDVVLEEIEETPVDVNPPPRKWRKKNRGVQRAAEEEKKRRMPEYPGVRNVTKRED
ncbi:hypothetical protein ES703_11370 [subsurface metagenome]